ncbi:MAG: Autophagy protein 22 [Cirrosporium novae-zelandiae]|nr:MAG: Autophagy protein 22 [Cirrosporium novae-zelandiae]
MDNESINSRQGAIPPHYSDEDTRLTSKKELAGWYSYGWASEVFVVCGVGSFIPITLEQLARENGVLLSDKITPCQSSYQTSVPSMSPFMTDGHSRPTTEQCIVYILGTEINTASFAMYTFSISVLFQALLIISMSGAADHGHSRKSFLLITAFIGAISTMLFLPVSPEIYLFGALFAIIANTCYGASSVLLNSFLPLLVRHHPSVQEPEDDAPDYFARAGRGMSHGNMAGGTFRRDSYYGETASITPLLADREPRISPSTEPSMTSVELSLSTRISSTGVGIGYIAAVVVQSFCIFIVVVTHSTVFSLRLALFIVGLWWLIFTVPPALWLRPRPGPPLRLPNRSKDSEPSTVAYITHAWTTLFHTLMRARRLLDMVLFLLAWFLLSDGIATVTGTAVLFAKTTLSMPPASLALINIIATLTGVLGAFSFSQLTSHYNIPANRTLSACIALMLLIPLYGLLPYIPAIKRLTWLGLQHPIEMYPLAAIYGFAIGGVSSHARSVFGELIPPGNEAAFYALFAITDKGSSVFGPAIVAAITDRFGSIRPAFLFLAVLLIVPLPLMAMVDVERGRNDARALVVDLEGDEIGGVHENGRAGVFDYGTIGEADGETDEEIDPRTIID